MYYDSVKWRYNEVLKNGNFKLDTLSNALVTSANEIKEN